MVDPDDCAVAENPPTAYRTPAALRIDDELINILVLVMTLVSATTTDASKPSNDINAVRCASSNRDDADVMFAQMMIPHHQQAVEMSEMLLAKDNIPDNVRDFAQGVVAAQGPEIERMNAMLTAWDEEPLMESGGMEGMDHGSSMDGMMS